MLLSEINCVNVNVNVNTIFQEINFCNSIIINKPGTMFYTCIINHLYQFVIFNPWKIMWNWIAFYWNFFVIWLGLIIVTRNGKIVWKQGWTGHSTRLCWKPSYTRTHSSLPCIKIQTNENARLLRLFVNSHITFLCD